MNKKTRNIIIAVIIIILAILLLQSCAKMSGGIIGGIVGGGGSPAVDNSVVPQCREGYTYVKEKCGCVPNPCPVGYTQGVLQAGYNTCTPPPNNTPSPRACSDIINPLSQRDCDAGICSTSGYVCIFHPETSTTVRTAAYCGC